MEVREQVRNGFSLIFGPVGDSQDEHDKAVFRLTTSKPRIDRFAFKCQYTKHAFVDSSERFLSDKSFQRLNAKSKLTKPIQFQSFLSHLQGADRYIHSNDLFELPILKKFTQELSFATAEIENRAGTTLTQHSLGVVFYEMLTG